MRNEIVAWLGDTWTAEQVEDLVQLIEEANTDAEADWVTIVAAYAGDEATEDVQAAATRDFARTEKA